MNIDAIFRPLAELERVLADLYAWYSEIFTADSDAAFVFFRMSAEEHGHARLIDYQKRLIQRNSSYSFPVNIDLDLIHTMLNTTRLARNPELNPTVEEAIRLALRLESCAAESHYKSALQGGDPEIARLFSALGGEDRRHVNRIEELAHSRGIDLQLSEDLNCADDAAILEPGSGEHQTSSVIPSTG